jgi:hypothetical protein
MLSEGLLMPNTVEKEIIFCSPRRPHVLVEECLEQHTIPYP